jgi:hypothetical protein
VIETDNDPLSAKPAKHPWPIRAFNGLQPVLDRIGLLPVLEVDSLIETARKKTGLDEFGDEWFREPLGMLVRSINEEASLSSLGRTILHTRLVGALVTRLRAEALFAAHPEILDIDLGHVFVIAGLQRTGTTVLHRLLSADPSMRAMLSWEALNPAPLPGEAPGRPTARIRQGKIAEKALAYISPQFFAIHPVEHDMPEEDVLLLDMSFMSQSAEATMRVPSYASWLEKQDNKPAYEYLRKLMQLLLWQQPAKHWVLKSPHHMEYIDVVLDVFPDATIIQTHRDPRKTMASFCSMVCHGAGVFSDQVDVKELSEHWTRKVKRLMERSMAVRSERGEAQFIDVSYYDLLEDPISQLRRIYEAGGVAFDDAAASAAQSSRQRQKQHKYGRHVYRLEDFGLSEEQIEHDFGFYRERHRIPVE